MKLLFHQENAWMHMSVVDMGKFTELLPHAPYSPDLALSDYLLFPNFQEGLGGKTLFGRRV